MNGRVSVAPCGHTGETIIGTYVKCLVGCDGPVAKPHRGETGHVNTCTCFGCKVRRSVTKVQLRTRKGTNYLEIPWDGTGNELKVDTKSGLAYYISSYRMVNDSEVLAQGALEDTYLEPNREITLDLSDLIKCAYEGTPTKVKVDFKDNSQVRYFNLGPGLAPKPAPAPAPVPAAAPPQIVSAQWVKIVFETGIATSGIKSVDVQANAAGDYDILIREFSIPHTTNWKTEQKKITQDAQFWCNTNIANVNPVVLDRSPAYSLEYSARQLPAMMMIFPKKTIPELIVDELYRLGFADKASITAALIYISQPNGKHTFELTWHGQKWSVTV